MKSVFWYALAALGEIAGCFAFWAWLRLGRSPWWILPGLVSLSLFALCLTRVDSAAAGRAYAAYGGVYIAASLLWLWGVEKIRPDPWDLTGAAICVAGAAVIFSVLERSLENSGRRLAPAAHTRVHPADRRIACPTRAYRQTVSARVFRTDVSGSGPGSPTRGTVFATSRNRLCRRKSVPRWTGRART